MSTLPSIKLHYKQGGSDKLYNILIEQSGDGHVVNFAYGRRGSTLRTGTKTKTPLPLGSPDDTGSKTAYGVYNALLKKQRSKGYTPIDGAGGDYVDVQVQKTDVYCQLLNPIDEDQVAALIADDDFWAQEKHDGKRMTIRHGDEARYDNETVAINRRGLTCGAPDAILNSYKQCPDAGIFDGEAVGEIHWVFDILDYPALPYSQRLAGLENYMPDLGPAVRLVYTAKTTAEKQALYDQLKAEGKEGIVFKRHAAPHTAGRPNSGGDQLKFKFYATATVLVSGHNDKRSVQMQAADDLGGMVDIGNVTIPPNHEVPPIHSFIEVRYLYAYEGGSLYQPTYLGVRDDKGTCDKIDTLKYKAV